MNPLMAQALKKDMEHYFAEDDLSRNLTYIQNLPMDRVVCTLKLKSDMVLAGLPWFIESFRFLGAADFTSDSLSKSEGQFFQGTATFEFELPFAIALTGERIALNLLQRASSVATFTRQFVQKAGPIKILDTRKTLPGLRGLDKYAVRVGGGHNHRMGQTDMWMVKDNHKNFFGGLKEAVAFFQKMGSFYNNVEVEIHDINELKQAIDLGINNVMLDNFAPDQVRDAVAYKKEGMTIEISGGISLNSIESYLIEGVDAISIGSLTYGAPPVDISLKYEKK